MYRHVLKPLLFRLDPEFVHDAFTWAGEKFGAFALTRWKINFLYGYPGPFSRRDSAAKNISKVLDGIRYRTPFLLSAGFDYNARLSRILPCIGLGGEEAGSVTARPCAGNPKPRLTRLPLSQSILVNKGLRNDGVDAVIARLKRTPRPLGPDGMPQFVVGISIARTNDAQSASVDAGIEDYAYSFKRLNEEGVGDFYTINISCPNAFGGEAFATPVLLEKLLARLKQIPCIKPVYVKMPINVPWPEFALLLQVIDKYGLHGVVIGNLNKNYASLDVRSEAPADYAGGLSGKPCRDLSLDLISRTRAAYGSRFTIFGVGGIMTPEHAIQTIEAGADLIQLITGLIYSGPSLIRKMCVAYSARIRQ